VTGELKTREFHKFDLDIKSNTYITKLWQINQIQ
jgi:hypothetical protein